jgi:crotonobetainyl-CoA:carnitine CoA-transferase CaiB-like acyl-CoA transferase
MLLEGIKVVSFCHFLQGPAAAQYLADMGADVIKVEPVGGAHERHWSGAGVFVEGVSGFYLCANRNKRSIGIDLKSKAGHQVASRLIASADVIMENFRPGVFARLGFDEARLKALNPELIVASASGFGSSGPMASRPGQDILIQAASGLVSATGAPSRGVAAVGAAICDQHGGALMAMGILAALFKRQRQGVVTRVESSLLNAGIDLQGEALVNYFAGNIPADRFQRHENLATWFHEAPYGIYPAKDGDIAISLCTDEALAEALESDALRALVGRDRYAERDRFAEAVRDATRTRTLADLGTRFEAHGVWYGPVQTYDDLAADAQIAHSKVFTEVDIRGRKVRLVNHPNRYDGEAPDVRFIALDVGEHTREIMAELGFSGSDTESFLSSGAIVEAEGNAG